MAIDPSFEYPGQIDTTDPVGYPQGAAQNVATPGDGTGTPWEERLVNDIFGFQQALLDAVGFTPSGDPDKVGASQYLDALRQLFSPRGLQHFSYTPNAQVKALGVTERIYDLASHPTGSANDQAEIMGCFGGGSQVLRGGRGDFWAVQGTTGVTSARSIAARLTDVTSVTWVVVGESNLISTSTNGGFAWTARTSAFSGGTIEKVRWGNGLFVAIGNGDEIQTSPDGITWTIRANPTTENLLSLHYGGGTWVAVGANGTVITSADGLSWVDRTGFSAVSVSQRAVTYDPNAGLWISGGSAALQTTPDPNVTSWTDRSSNLVTNEVVQSLVYGDEAVLMVTEDVVADADRIGVSFDGGATWDIRRYNLCSPVGKFQGAEWVDGRWFVAGEDNDLDGVIVTSLRS